MSTLRVNDATITAENAFNPDDLWMEGKLESKTKVKPSFRYFCWFMSGALTLRPRKTYVYVFRAFGNWMVKSKVPPQSGCSLEAVELHP